MNGPSEYEETIRWHRLRRPLPQEKYGELVALGSQERLFLVEWRQGRFVDTVSALNEWGSTPGAVILAWAEMPTGEGY